MGGKSIREVKSVPVRVPESNKIKTTILIITKNSSDTPFLLETKNVRGPTNKILDQLIKYWNTVS